MDTQIKERRVAQRIRRDPVGPAVAPDSVADTKADQQTDQAMKRMVKILRNKKHQNETLTVEQLSANPKSFSQFIENIFTLSFLVKDGEAGLTPPPEGGWLARPSHAGWRAPARAAGWRAGTFGCGDANQAAGEGEEEREERGEREFTDAKSASERTESGRLPATRDEISEQLYFAG